MYVLSVVACPLVFLSWIANVLGFADVMHQTLTYDAHQYAHTYTVVCVNYHMPNSMAYSIESEEKPDPTNNTSSFA